MVAAWPHDCFAAETNPSACWTLAESPEKVGLGERCRLGLACQGDRCVEIVTGGGEVVVLHVQAADLRPRADLAGAVALGDLHVEQPLLDGDRRGKVLDRDVSSNEGRRDVGKILDGPLALVDSGQVRLAFSDDPQSIAREPWTNRMGIGQLGRLHQQQEPVHRPANVRALTGAKAPRRDTARRRRIGRGL